MRRSTGGSRQVQARLPTPALWCSPEYLVRGHYQGGHGDGLDGGGVMSGRVVVQGRRVRRDLLAAVQHGVPGMERGRLALSPVLGIHGACIQGLGGTLRGAGTRGGGDVHGRARAKDDVFVTLQTVGSGEQRPGGLRCVRSCTCWPAGAAAAPNPPSVLSG